MSMWRQHRAPTDCSRYVLSAKPWSPPVIRALVTLPRLGAFSARLLMLRCGKKRQHSRGCSVASMIAKTCSRANALELHCFVRRSRGTRLKGQAAIAAY